MTKKIKDGTSISWTDYTFNPWWGCTRIAPGCDNCYAAAFDKRFGGDYWNPKIKPRLTSQFNWNKVLKWENKAKKENKRYKVFCGSMMDWCDKNAPKGALSKLWELIRKTPNLDWQLLTKRASLIRECLPEDWGKGYDNVWLGVTVEDKKYGYKRVDELQTIPCKVRFLSCEPLLQNISNICLRNIHWVIIGGESGSNYRPMSEIWANDLIFVCKEHGVNVWFKQHGGNGKDKGGCTINGKEYKQWPNFNLEGSVWFDRGMLRKVVPGGGDIPSWVWHDGGRHEAGFRGRAGDCVTRAIALATGRTYKDVYYDMSLINKKDRGVMAGRGGVITDSEHFLMYMEGLGFRFSPHWCCPPRKLNLADLPYGVLIIKLEGHLSAMIGGVIYDTFNPNDSKKHKQQTILGYWLLKDKDVFTPKECLVPEAKPKIKIVFNKPDYLFSELN